MRCILLMAMLLLSLNLMSDIIMQENVAENDDLITEDFYKIEKSQPDSLDVTLAAPADTTENNEKENPKKRKTVTIEEINDFIENDKDNFVYKKDMDYLPLYPNYKINRMWLTPTLSNNTYNEYLRNFGSARDNRFKNTKYSYPVSITRLYAGLGEFDKNFSHISFMKDEFLGLDHLYIRGDFKGSDEQINVGGSDVNLRALDTQVQAEYQLKDFTAKTVFFSTDSDRTVSNVKWNFQSFELAWKYFFGGYASTETKYEDSQSKFTEEIYIAGLQYHSDIVDIELYKQNSVMNNESKQFSGSNLSFNSGRVDLSFDVYTNDKFDSIQAIGDISVFLYKNYYSRAMVSYTDYKSPFTTLYEKQHIKAGLEYKNDHQYANILVGEKRLEEQRIIAISESFATLSSEVRLQIPVLSFILDFKNDFEYNNLSEGFYLVPEYKNTADISLVYATHPDNKWVVIGTRMYILSDIFTTDTPSVHTDPIFDLYTAIGITKYFDLCIELNNINRNWNYGNNEIQDFHFTTYLMWYFLN